MSNAEKRNPSQKKQLIIMVILLAVCAVLVTWTVLLLKDRIDRNQTIEQTSQYDLAEVSENPEAETTAPITGLWEDVLGDVTVITTERVRATLPTTESAPPATRKFVTQPAVFVKVTTARGAVSQKKTAAPAGTTKKQQGAAATTPALGTKTTTTTAKPQTAPHTTQRPATTPPPQTVTQPQTTPAPAVTPQAPSSAQVIYNQLLAVYLGAGAQNGKAYYYEPAGNGQPTVVVGNADGFAGVYRTDDCAKRIPLGGTSDSDNPWQTGTDFVFRKSGSGSDYVFYESEGANNRVVGGFNPDTGDNIWMRLHYTEENGTVKAEYHLYRKNEAGVQNELSSGTGDADRVYALPADIAAIAAAAGFPSGDISALPEVAANSQDDIAALRNRAGTYNDGFTLQPGCIYGVIGANSDNVYLRSGMSLASNIIASLPAGTFVCVDSNFDPDTAGVWCPVSVTLNGKTSSGYVSAVYVLTWKAE